LARLRERVERIKAVPERLVGVGMVLDTISNGEVVSYRFEIEV
jgi:hypothetical protein